ncbi:hypothetical protein H5410_012382 [Solanum commersonii]|uniref:Uncharacterized protein n=1 Tax=Solanum commersonii TaxID=4109 RepID=A0A9J6AS08_SOLCO|nr:hypothetical protein H5410_012382 [Solanum commersonii]
MATMAGGQPLMEVVRPPEMTAEGTQMRRSYADVVQPQVSKQVPKTNEANHDTAWRTTKLFGRKRKYHDDCKLTIEYAIIGKFSYGWPQIQVPRKLIPLQWIRLFNPEAETTIAVGMDFFHHYPQISLGRSQFFYCSNAVGKPLQVDTATTNRPGPSSCKWSKLRKLHSVECSKHDGYTIRKRKLTHREESKYRKPRCNSSQREDNIIMKGDRGMEWKTGSRRRQLARIFTE